MLRGSLRMRAASASTKRSPAFRSAVRTTTASELRPPIRFSSSSRATADGAPCGKSSRRSVRRSPYSRTAKGAAETRMMNPMIAMNHGLATESAE